MLREMELQRPELISHLRAFGEMESEAFDVDGVDCAEADEAAAPVDVL
jgi:hypothetical protein